MNYDGYMCIYHYELRGSFRPHRNKELVDRLQMKTQPDSIWELISITIRSRFPFHFRAKVGEMWMNDVPLHSANFETEIPIMSHLRLQPSTTVEFYISPPLIETRRWNRVRIYLSGIKYAVQGSRDTGHEPRDTQT